MADRADAISGVATADEGLVVELVGLDVDLEVGVAEPVFGVSQVEEDFVFRGAFKDGAWERGCKTFFFLCRSYWGKIS